MIRKTTKFLTAYLLVGMLAISTAAKTSSTQNTMIIAFEPRLSKNISLSTYTKDQISFDIREAKSKYEEPSTKQLGRISFTKGESGVSVTKFETNSGKSLVIDIRTKVGGHLSIVLANGVKTLRIEVPRLQMFDISNLMRSSLASEFFAEIGKDQAIFALIKGTSKGFGLDKSLPGSFGISDSCQADDGDCFLAITGCIFGTAAVVGGFLALGGATGVACALTGPGAALCIGLALASVAGGGLAFGFGCGNLSDCGGETDVAVANGHIYVSTVIILDDDEFEVDCSDPLIDCVDDFSPQLPIRY